MDSNLVDCPNVDSGIPNEALLGAEHLSFVGAEDIAISTHSINTIN